MSTALAALDPATKKKVMIGAAIGGALGLLAWLFWPKSAGASPREPGPNPATDRTIAEGETLSTIAASLYGGRSAQYLAIMLLDRNRANSSAVVHLNLIRAGATLKVPTSAAVAALPASVKDSYKARWSAYIALGNPGWNANVNPATMNAVIGMPTPLI